jgi:hypothetical protein
MPIPIKKQEVAKYYEINKCKDEQYDRDTETPKLDPPS